MNENEINQLKMYFDRAQEFRDEGEFKYAIEVLNKALELDEHNTDAMNMLGEIYSESNNWEGSIECYQKVLEIDPQNRFALSALYNNYFKLGKFNDALNIAQKSVELEGCEKNYLKLIAVLDKFADIKALRELVKNNNLSAEVLFKTAIIFINHAFIDDAAKIVDRISSIDEKIALEALIAFNKNDLITSRKKVFEINIQNSEILNLKGIFYLEDMNFEDAIRYFSSAILIDKSVPKYFYNLANAYFYNGWKDEAISAYKHAIELDKSNCDYRFALANLYMEMSDINKAKQEISNILAIDSDHAEAKILNAIIKHKNKDLLGAKQDLENVLKLYPNKLWAKTALISVLIDLGYFDKADLVIKTINDTGDNPELMSAKAYLAYCRGEYIKSLDYTNKILKKSEFYMPALTIAMQSAYMLGKFELVQRYAQQSISADINFSQGYYYLGLVRQNEGDYDEAIECLKRAITFDLTNPRNYLKMAELYEAKNDNKTALGYAGEALAIDENSTEIKEIYSRLAKQSRKICQKN